MTAASSDHKDLTKLTARFFAPMYADFDRQMSSALLRRDAFLDRVIAGEIQHIRTSFSDSWAVVESPSLTIKWQAQRFLLYHPSATPQLW